MNADPRREPRPITVRPYRPEDADFVDSLASRLTIGMPAWRDLQHCLAAVERWIADSTQQHGRQTTVFVAADDRGERLGFASIGVETHFTGERQASIGELAVRADAASAHTSEVRILAMIRCFLLIW